MKRLERSIARDSVRLTLVTCPAAGVLSAVRYLTEGRLKRAQIDENPARVLHMWNQAISRQHLHIFLPPAKPRETDSEGFGEVTFYINTPTKNKN